MGPVSQLLVEIRETKSSETPSDRLLRPIHNLRDRTASMLTEEKESTYTFRYALTVFLCDSE